MWGPRMGKFSCQKKENRNVILSEESGFKQAGIIFWGPWGRKKEGKKISEEHHMITLPG